MMRGNMETFITFVKRAISKEDTRKRTRLKFVGIVWPKIGPTSAAKYFEKRIIGWRFKSDIHQPNQIVLLDFSIEISFNIGLKFEKDMANITF